MKFELEKKTILLLGITLSIYFIICYIYQKPNGDDNYINFQKTVSKNNTLSVDKLFTGLITSTNSSISNLENKITNKINESQNNQINVENNFEKLKENMIDEIVYQTEKDLNELNYDLFYKTNKLNYDTL
jgi:tRNA A37 threonylcarbamoyltransferase TsaD